MELKDVSTEALEAELSARKDAEQPEEYAFKLAVYYRDGAKNLRRIDADCNTVQEGTKLVMRELNKAKEVFFKPLLGLISCGKNDNTEKEVA